LAKKKTSGKKNALSLIIKGDTSDAKLRFYFIVFYLPPHLLVLELLQLLWFEHAAESLYEAHCLQAAQWYEDTHVAV
jgi:hypothetical protein